MSDITILILLIAFLAVSVVLIFWMLWRVERAVEDLKRIAKDIEEGGGRK